MTEFLMHRRSKTLRATIGCLHVADEAVWTLEDPQREHKVYGDTRIPAGRYELTLRTEGGMHERYTLRFPDMHQGMVWLRQVPLFEWVYIHIGNGPEDTEGCILVGMARDGDRIYKSTEAYKLIYPRMVEAIKEGPTFLIIDDEVG